MKEGYKFSHWGGAVSIDQKPENYLEGGKVWFSDFDKDEFAVEKLYFEPDSPMPEILKQKNHAAFFVDDLAKAMDGKKVIVEPFKVNDKLTCAFIEYCGFPIELMELKD